MMRCGFRKCRRVDLRMKRRAHKMKWPTRWQCQGIHPRRSTWWWAPWMLNMNYKLALRSDLCDGQNRNEFAWCVAAAAKNKNYLVELKDLLFVVSGLSPGDKKERLRTEAVDNRWCIINHRPRSSYLSAHKRMPRMVCAHWLSRFLLQWIHATPNSHHLTVYANYLLLV